MNGKDGGVFEDGVLWEQTFNELMGVDGAKSRVHSSLKVYIVVWVRSI